MGGCCSTPDPQANERARKIRLQKSRESTKQYGDMYKREWHSFDREKDDTPTFKVMEFNILGDVYAGADKWLGGFAMGWETPQKKNEEGAEAMKWKFRSERLLEEILRNNPDIMTLVELDRPHDNDWAERELGKLGYAVDYAGCNPLGAAIVYRTSKFEPIGDVTLFEVDAKKGPYGLYRAVKWKATGQEFGLMVCHMKSGEEAKSAKKRLQQLEGILKNIPKDRPIIWGLDMNSPPEGKTYHMVMTNKDLNLHSAYSNTTYPGATQKFSHEAGGLEVLEPEYTTWKKRKAGNQPDKIGIEFKRTIDYIFFNKDNFEVVGLLGFPSDDLLDPENLLPDYKYPSDHYAIMAEFQAASKLT